jgi:hypothetical protein
MATCGGSLQREGSTGRFVVCPEISRLDFHDPSGDFVSTVSTFRLRGCAWNQRGSTLAFIA